MNVYEMPKVSNMLGRTGKPVFNQFIVVTGEGYVFQSYRSSIAFFDYESNKLYLGCDWDRSRTTSKYLAQFLRVYAPKWYARLNAYGKRSLSENIRAAISAGEIVYLDNWS